MAVFRALWAGFDCPGSAAFLSRLAIGFHRMLFNRLAIEGEPDEESHHAGISIRDFLVINLNLHKAFVIKRKLCQKGSFLTHSPAKEKRSVFNDLKPIKFNSPFLLFLFSSNFRAARALRSCRSRRSAARRRIRRSAGICSPPSAFCTIR